MVEGISVQKHLNNFNSIIVDLESLNVKIEDEDKAILLVVSLPQSHKNLKEIMLYTNSDSISFEDVKSNLLSKEKVDHDIHPDFVVGLVVRGRPTEKRGGTVVGERTILSLEILIQVRPAITVIN